MSNIVEEFYQAFSDLDAEKMAACYHDDICFADPAFGQLQGERARNMWRMLVESQKGKDFKVFAKDIVCDGQTGSATWEAHYTFGSSGRPVHNIIQAKFKIQDSKIISHLDDFNLHRWAGQAMGFSGMIIGWTSFFRTRLLKQTSTLLDRYEAKQ
jgi:ketosteroid isomerase-like protein